MSLFNKLTTNDLETPKDQLGGGFKVRESGLYQAIIKVVYVTFTTGGAMAVTLVADIDGGEYKETFYVTSKEGKNYYTTANDPDKKKPLPGFTQVNDICLMAAGKPLAEIETEEKVIRVWDFDVGGLVAKSLPCITELENQPITLGILKVLENKNTKDGNGIYVPTAETREFNETDKVFHPETQQTVAEGLNEQDASFYSSWDKRNTGNTRDKRKIKDGDTSSAPPKPGMAPQAKPASKPMFGKRS